MRRHRKADTGDGAAKMASQGMSAAPDPAKAPPVLGEEGTFGPRRVRAWFRRQNQRTSAWTLAAALISLAVVGALGLCNIRLQIGRPELDPISAHLFLAKGSLPWNGIVQWRDVGKKRARNLYLTVYVAEKNGMRQIKLWAGPSAGGGFQLGVLDDLPDHLLICAAYVDESMKKYRQAFRYRVLPPYSFPGPPAIWAQLEEELPRPSGEICR
jgi:hypothetical protein